MVADFKVKMMLSDNRGMHNGDIKFYDTEATYARITRLLASGHEVLQIVLKHELAPVPSSLFSKEGYMLITTQKHILKDQLQVDVSYKSLRKRVHRLEDL